MREDGVPVLGVHGLELGEDVEHLRRGVDGDEDVGDGEVVAVPEEHPGANAEVAEYVIGHVFGDGVDIVFVGGVGGGELPELVEPG